MLHFAAVKRPGVQSDARVRPKPAIARLVLGGTSPYFPQDCGVGCSRLCPATEPVCGRLAPNGASRRRFIGLKRHAPSFYQILRVRQLIVVQIACGVCAVEIFEWPNTRRAYSVPLSRQISVPHSCEFGIWHLAVGTGRVRSTEYPVPSAQCRVPKCQVASTKCRSRGAMVDVGDCGRVSASRWCSTLKAFYSTAQGRSPLCGLRWVGPAQRHSTPKELRAFRRAVQPLGWCFLLRNPGSPRRAGQKRLGCGVELPAGAFREQIPSSRSVCKK